MQPNYFISSLAQTLTVGGNDSQIALSTIYTQDGQIVTTADFAAFGRGILTINPTSLSNVEFSSFTTVDPTIGLNGGVSGVLRGLSFKGNNQIAANQKFNVIGTPVIIAFGTHNIQDLKTYIDNIAIAAGVFATVSTLGTVKLSVAPASTSNPIAVETTDPRVPVAYAVDSVGTDAYAITPIPAETAYVIGKTYSFKAGTANTGACSLNVSGLGAKTIKKDVSSDLATGDILANQIVMCKYDGTNMQIISKIPQGVIDGATQISGLIPAVNITTLSTSGTGAPTSTSTTQTITHGLGKIPKIIKIRGLGNKTGQESGSTSLTDNSDSYGTYNASGNNCVYIPAGTGNGGLSPSTSNSFSVYLEAVRSTTGTATGVIQNVGATTFDIVWTVSSSGPSGQSVYLWEAE